MTWWACPNLPPCPHGGALHDVEDLADEVPRCCVDGCDCGHDREMHLLARVEPVKRIEFGDLAREIPLKRYGTVDPDDLCNLGADHIEVRAALRIAEPARWERIPVECRSHRTTEEHDCFVMDCAGLPWDLETGT